MLDHYIKQLQTISINISFLYQVTFCGVGQSK